MSIKERKEKLGRNPFEQKKPARKPKPYEEPMRARPEAQESRTEAAPVSMGGAEGAAVQNPLVEPQPLSNVPATATLVWLCVDLWSSTFFEPVFFWMNSPKIVRETIKVSSGREA